MTPPPDWDPLPTCVSGLPALPAEFDETIAVGIAALGVQLSPGQRTALADHVRLLLAWNAAINLTAIRDPLAMAREHVLDSLAAMPILVRADIDAFVDLGSGAGFPGLPLAIALPGARVLLVDSIGKKARFLAAAAGAVGLEGRVEVAAARAESLAPRPQHRGRWPAVVARAVADLSELSELALPLLRTGGLLVAWKRAPFDEELRAAERMLPEMGGRIASVEPVAVAGLEDHVLAVVEKMGQTPARFPRDPTARRRGR
jgi:16S rRNA (guanine527-N7)-methyltransferase